MGFSEMANSEQALHNDVIKWKLKLGNGKDIEHAGENDDHINKKDISNFIKGV